MSQVWFARRFPVGHPRNAMAPVSPEGWRVVWVFVSAMVGGGVLAVILLLIGISTNSVAAFVLAPLVFVAFALGGAIYFIRTASSRGDMTRTVEDYRRMGNGAV